MLTYDEALRIVLDAVPAPAPAEIPLVEAIGLALSRDVVADRDSPPFTASAMDGYAVRSEDVRPGAVLEILEEIRAGRAPTVTVGSGEASAIMTGAALPEGADAVVLVEDTETAGEGRVRLLAGVEPGTHVRPRGENRRAGEWVIRAGTAIGVAESAILASVGCVRVPVHARPAVAVAATGDEIVPVEVPPGPYQIRNSNSTCLMSFVRAAGGVPFALGIVEDDEEATRRAIREGLEHDVLLISGGVSMGSRDLVVDALEAEGVEVLFHRVAVKPGKPVLMARRGRTIVFGLPGNPVSVFVSFELFVRPALRRLVGHASVLRPTASARLATDLREGGRRTTYRPAVVRFEDGEPVVTPSAWRGSGDLPALAGVNALLVVPAGASPAGAGDRAEVLLLDGAVSA